MKRHLKGLRFTQHYKWWQYINRVAILAWDFEDPANDEVKVAEHIRTHGVIDGDSIGTHSDSEWGHQHRAREIGQAQRRWAAKQRARQMARERRIAKERQAEERLRLDRELDQVNDLALANENVPIRCATCGKAAAFPHENEWFCDEHIDAAYGRRARVRT